MTAPDRQGIQPRTSLAPVAIDWTAERGQRGGGVSGGARCTVRGCAIRYRAGSDRLCPDHAAADADDDSGNDNGNGETASGGYRWNGAASTEDDDAAAGMRQTAAERAAAWRSPAAERRNARDRAERAAAAGMRQTAAARAAAWLAAYLAGRGGRAGYHVIIAAAADAGHSPTACRAARRMLALTSARTDRANGEPFRTDWVLESEPASLGAGAVPLSAAC